MLRENDAVKLAVPLPGRDITAGREVTVERGESGVIVLIYGSEENPVAYVVEFYYPEKNLCVLVTAEPEYILKE